jgi:hypothetical protein
MNRLYLTPNTKEGFINVNPNLPQSLDVCTEPLKRPVQWHIATVKYLLYTSFVNPSQNRHHNDHHPCCWLYNTLHMLHETTVKYNYFLYVISILSKIFKFLQKETCKIWGFHGGDYEEWDCSLQPPAHAGSSLADFSTLKMETISSSETPVHTRTTRRHIPEDGILQKDTCVSV